MSATPRELGPYRLDVLLGRGGMGEVYRAWDARLERWVAIKRLLDTSDAAARTRFLREARAAAGLGHPAILQVFDVLEEGGTDWIVMEMIDGPDLATLLQDGPLDAGLVLDYGRQIAGGLAAAHAKGIVHRDLKTENVMVLASGHIKVLDFGLAKVLDLGGDGAATTGDSAALSRAGRLAGTPRAMSPEQARGYEVDFRSDLFALGVLLYELSTARSPFRGRTVEETLARVLIHRQTPIRRLNPLVPSALADLVNHLLEKEPDNRPAGASAVAEALTEITTDNPLYETSRSEDGLLDVTTLVGTVAAEAYPEEAAVHAGREAPLTLRTWPPPELPEQPYPVLLPYTHPDLMAGCEEEIKKLHVHLQMPVPILGLGAPSGTGKSSLLAGGLVPDLRAKGPGSEPPGKQSRLLAASALQWAAQRLFGRRGRSWTPPFFQQHRLEWLTKHAMPRCPGPCARVRLSPEAVESPGKMPNE